MQRIIADKDKDIIYDKNGFIRTGTSKNSNKILKKLSPQQG
jgi:hypothetical protein